MADQSMSGEGSSPQDNDDFLNSAIATRRADTLRFLTCGSVDDGKSTMIGRLLYDSKLLMEDQLAQLADDSTRFGTTEDEVDFALLVDGLEAEREQGITIDVAYRYFSTARRRFIVADTPGHEQYTRNMATGASTADLAILLVDATKGLLTQTRRHALIVSLLKVRHVVLAVNKMDLVDFSSERFAEIEEDFRSFCANLGFESLVAIPIAARWGDNMTGRSDRTPWYEGPTLLPYLEEVEVSQEAQTGALRLPVQWVCRPDRTFRGFAGSVVGGTVSIGDDIVVAGSGTSSQVTSIKVGETSIENAVAGQSVLLTLADEVDCSRGDMLVAPKARPEVSDQFAAHIIWMNDEPLLPGRQYLLKSATGTRPATVTELKHRLDVENLDKMAAKELHLNEIGYCNFSLSEPMPFDPYIENRSTGSFILIDRFTDATLGAGMVDFSLRRAANIHWQAIDVSKAARAGLKHQKPTIVWFTGLSGSGKSTVANLLEKKLFALGRHTIILDGDNVRHGLNRDLGFTEADRVENIRRVAETAKLMTEAGLIVLVSFISPFRSERALARSLVKKGDFVEVFVDAPLSVCQERDPKGLYARAISGELKNFTGIDSPYETPKNPDIRLDAGDHPPDELADRVYQYLDRMGRLSGN